MSYGPQTKLVLASLSRSETLETAVQWEPERYTAPFLDRLADFVSAYNDIPTAPEEQKTALTELIQAGAAAHGVKLARNTLAEWLSGRREPSVSSSDSQTRENIYRLCAALDLDYELSMELFEKVFFSGAFFTGNLRELCFLYHASRDFRAGVEGCRWYEEGDMLWKKVSAAADEAPKAGDAPDSRMILACADALDEEAFCVWLLANRDTFRRETQFGRARASVVELASAAAGTAPGGEIPYEPLITHILDYSQRSVAHGSGGPISGLRALPAQLVTNFPTGQILRRICLGEACSYDQMYKMLALLLFYTYHARADSSFDAFLRYANLSLTQAGFPELYPRQPYGGFLLSCAAQPDPLDALRQFVRRAVQRESEAALSEKIQKELSLRPELCTRLIEAAERDPFLVDLIVGTLLRPSASAKPARLTEFGEYEDPSSELIGYLCTHAGFSEPEKHVLYCCALLPPDGVSDRLFRLLFQESSLQTALGLAKSGWLNHGKDNWSMNYRIRKTVANQNYARENYAHFINKSVQLSSEELTDRDTRQLSKILRRKPL